jgi:hypothetical protein
MITYSMQYSGVFTSSLFSNIKPAFVQLPQRLPILRTTISGRETPSDRAD